MHAGFRATVLVIIGVLSMCSVSNGDPVVSPGWQIEVYLDNLPPFASLTFDSDKNLYYITSTGDVLRVDPSLHQATTPVASFGGRCMITFNPMVQLFYIGLLDKPEVWKLGIDGSKELLASLDGDTHFLSYDNSGNCYAPLYYIGGYDLVSSTGAVKRYAGAVGTYQDVTGVTYGPDGFIYLCARAANQIFRTPNTKDDSQLFANVETPEQVAFLPDGNLIANSLVPGKINIISPNGVVSTLVSGIKGPRAPILGPDLSIYFPESETKIMRLTKLDGFTQTPDAEVSLEQHGPRNVDVIVSSLEAIQGGELGFAYDPAVVTPLAAQGGPDLPAGSQIQFQDDPQIGCDPDAGVFAGFIVGWLNPSSPQVVTPPGKHRLVTIRFGLAPGGNLYSCSPLRFVSCLGVKEAPVKNIVTGQDGKSQPASTVDGQVCVGPDSFRRGDVNGD